MKVRERSFPYILEAGERHPKAGRKGASDDIRMRTNVTRTTEAGGTEKVRPELLSHSGASEYITTTLVAPTPEKISVDESAVEAVKAMGLTVTKTKHGHSATIPVELMPRSAGPVVFPGRRLLRALHGHGLTASATSISKV